MDIVHMQQNVLRIMEIKLRSEDEIRYLLLYSKEKLLHEDMEDMETYMVPAKFQELDDCERRGLIRALRWVIDETDEGLH